MPGRCIRVCTIFCLSIMTLAEMAWSSGTVSTVSEAALDTALTGGGNVTFSTSGTITITTQKVISVNTTIDGAGQTVTLSGSTTRLFWVNSETLRK